MKVKQKMKEMGLSEIVIASKRHENGIPVDFTPTVTILFAVGAHKEDPKNKMVVTYGFAVKSDRDEQYIPRIGRTIALKRIAEKPGIFVADIAEVNKIGVTDGLPLLIAIDILKKLDTVVFKKLFVSNSRTKAIFKSMLSSYIESYFRGDRNKK